MTSTRLRRTAAACAVALLTVACGGATAGSDDPAAPDTTAAVAETTTTPAVAETTTEAPAADTTVATETTAGDQSPPGDAVELTIEADSNEGFSTSKLEAPAGVAVTVTFVNNDTGSGEPHNWRVKTDAGDYATPITLGRDTNSVTFTIDTPGEYEFLCDTHPTAMRGTLVITG
jgi:plastocyanin